VKSFDMDGHHILDEGGKSYICEICGGVGYITSDGLEGPLPSNCPGRELTPTEMVRIDTKEIDFINGDWHDK